MPELEAITMDLVISIPILDARLEQQALASTSAASEVDASMTSAPVTAPEAPPTVPGVEATPPVAAAAATAV